VNNYKNLATRVPASTALMTIEKSSIETSAEMEMENITRMETRELFTSAIRREKVKSFII
jgi:hypothetical protein